MLPKHFILLVFIFCLSAQSLYSQRDPFKVGKAKMADIDIDSCSFYPEANSMIVSEFGDLRFLYDDNNGWQFKLEVNVRMKIFDIVDAAEAGNIRIRAYEPDKGVSEEEIKSVKAYSYNIVDGDLERTKLKSKEIFKKRLNDYWVEYSFAIPNVQKGSLIDYSYFKVSDYITNLHTWQFQKDIPVARSEFRYALPEWFNYQSNQLGNFVVADSKSSNRKNEFEIKWSKLGQGGEIKKGVYTLESNDKVEILIAKNVLPLEEEPYMNNESDVPSRVEFQLISTHFPNTDVKVVAGNYPSFNEEMIQSSSLGGAITNGRFFKDFEVDETDPVKAAVQIYDHLNKRLSWNEVNTFRSADAGRKVYKDKEGNVAGLNLTLIAALREKGIEAYPIILSTRGNGTVHPVYPSYNDFNYLIALVKIGEKSLFCDLTSGLPFGQLPLRCRNGNGWMIAESGGAWINMKENSKFSKLAVVKTIISQDSILSEVTTRAEGYAAIQTINSIKKESLETFETDIAADFENMDIRSFEVSDLNYNEPLDVKYTLAKAIDSEDIIYIETPTWNSIESNPFKKDTRFSPIDFAFNQNFRVISSLVIPEGYSVEVPESVLIKLPEDAGSFIFQVSQNGTTINLSSTVQIDKNIFSILEYPQLKTFYELIEKKHGELIILKKI